MDATLIHHSKVINADGSIEEIIIWKLPEKTKNYSHGIKYRLYFGLANGSCLLRYDNEKFKGDHRHIREREEPYMFSTIEQLLLDFEAAVRKIKLGKL
jgi:hypothetical protein